MSLYSIFVVNTAPDCDNSIEQQVTITGCTNYILRLASNSNAIGPFDVYYSTYPDPLSAASIYYSAKTRNEMLMGVIISFECTPTPTPTPNITPSVSITPTITPTETSTPTVTPTVSPTSSLTPTTTETPTETPTQTPTPTTSEPSFTAYLFIDRNDATIRAALNSYMLAQGSAFRGFNITSPSTTQATFDSQMNAYIAYSGWGVSEPSIVTAQISTTTGGLDAYGNGIEAYKFQTILVSASTVPAAEQAWYTWIVSTAATNGQKYTTTKQGTSNPPGTSLSPNATYTNLIVNYSGSTNIPADVYRIYTSKPGAGSNITNNGNNYYFQGGNLA